VSTCWPSSRLATRPERRCPRGQRRFVVVAGMTEIY
jgi:hypothetical protein